MTRREQMISKLIDMAVELAKNYTWDKWYELLNTVCDWNSEHEESEEIFVCELYKEDGYENNGIMINDDYFLYEE